ncbi:hypothetical protein AHF37_01849 [Paragonimus kellicotti]|nr:hypothetical protein AHF37_01849 [Paragonimus kellicotti]
MRRVDTSVTYAALRLHRLVRRRANYRILLQKLKVIASLQAAQPTIQMLLRSNDFCAALDLVASTQDLLVLSSSTSDDRPHTTSDSANSQFRQLTCLRHLNAQLTEISRFVRHMIEAEFEAALCQFMEPRTSCGQYVEPDLVPCLLGLLHIKRHDFVSAFRAELIRQVKRTQQRYCTGVASTVQDSTKPSISMKERLRDLSNEAWLQLIANRCTEFQALLSRAERCFLRRICKTALCVVHTSTLDHMFIPLARFVLLASNKNHRTAIEYSVSKERRQHNVLQHVENLFREHVDQINDKLFNLLSNRIQDRLSVWVVRPPTPSAELRAICRALSRLCEMNADVMPADQLTQHIDSSPPPAVMQLLLLGILVVGVNVSHTVTTVRFPIRISTSHGSRLTELDVGGIRHF